MKYSVAFYSPDQHIRYNLRTLDEHGVGGGITARLRMAHALAARGHAVTAYVHCPVEGELAGVQYYHFSRLKRVDTDVFLASTSGGGLNLSSLHELEINARLRLLMVHGVDPPQGAALGFFDYLYALSNFVRGRIVQRWGIEQSKIFVVHRGVRDDFFPTPSWQPPRRDPWALVYSGHPSKGLDAAIGVLRHLRREDPRFSLHVFGGPQLWGEEGQPVSGEPGMEYHGMVGQKELAQRLATCSFSLNLQTRQEPFGMTVIEAMRAGCVVLASRVGAYPEIVQHGHNGFLLEGHPADEETITRAARLILALTRNPAYVDFIRRNAVRYPLAWETIAAAWEGHWDWALEGTEPLAASFNLGGCPFCGGDRLALADGFHCTDCGFYQRSPL